MGFRLRGWSSSLARRVPTGSAYEASASRQEERQLGEEDQNQEADEERDEIRPVRAEVAPHRDVGEAQGHEKTNAHRRPKETDADGGREHGGEVEGGDAGLPGDRGD